MMERKKTKSINFDKYDTQKLAESLKLLNKVYEFNFDGSRKIKLLETVIRKLEAIINDYGENE